MIKDDNEQSGVLVVYIAIGWALIVLSGLCGGLYYVLTNWR
jgi:hypothetical protein